MTILMQIGAAIEDMLIVCNSSN